MIARMPKGLLRSALLLALLAAVSVAMMASATLFTRNGLGSEAYVLPLVGHLAIRRESLVDGHGNAPGSCQLLETFSPGSRSASIRFRDVKRIAIMDEYVVGETGTGFFICNSAAQGYEEPKLIASRESWQTALDAAGVPRDLKLSEPDAMAAGVSNRVLRRSQMHVMHGALSLTDEEWEGVLIIGSWLFMFLFGTYAKKPQIVPATVIAGMFSIGFARIFLGGLGPDLLAGVFDPLVGIGAGYLGRFVGIGARMVVGPKPQNAVVSG